MHALKLRPDQSTNAFLDLESHLGAMELSGRRLAAATQTLRASARLFAAATVRLQASTTRRGPAPGPRKERHLTLVK